MLVTENSNQIQSHNDLYTLALSLVNQHLSVIPIRQNKIAAELWKIFQSQLPTAAMLHQWFVDCTYPALAVVCGSISQLIILDFDTEAQFTRFQSEHPSLVDTLTIRTRRGWHLWYRIPAKIHIASRKAEGIDLLAEGKYAVVPPSTINGYMYTFANQLPIMAITHKDIQRINTFVGGAINEPETGETAPPLSTQELLGRYCKHAAVGNRNEALFKAAIAARDAGWTKAAVMDLLVSQHIAAGTYGENFDKREREAVNTINSAFSRSARTVLAETLSLPNSIRESLCQQGLTCVVRLIEALWRHRYKSGDLVHPTTLWRELKDIIGRHSIYKALKAMLENGTSLFDRYELVSPRTPSDEASASHPSTDSDKMLLSVRKNRQKPNSGGRPAIFYRIPSIADLFKRLGISPSRTSDELPEATLRSAKNTRKHLHESLLRRRPGRYGRAKLAERVGVCVRTLDTYHKEFKETYPDFNKRHRYLETPLFWNNLNLIPSEDTLHNGVFLLDDTGQRYPAKRSIAVLLLKRKCKVSLMRQTWNEYWFGSRFGPPSLLQQPQKQEAARDTQSELWREPAQRYWAALHDAPETRNRAKTGKFGDLTESTTQRSSEVKKPLKTSQSASKDKKPHNPRRKFPYAEDEALVERLQERMNRLCKKPGQGISKRTLRQLINQYGKLAVKAAVKGIEERTYIDDNPVGFLVVMLRSDSKRDELKALLGQLR